MSSPEKNESTGVDNSAAELRRRISKLAGDVSSIDDAEPLLNLALDTVHSMETAARRHDKVELGFAERIAEARAAMRRILAEPHSDRCSRASTAGSKCFCHIHIASAALAAMEPSR